MERRLTIAIEAAIKAGIEIEKLYKTENYNFQLKEDNSPLTVADKASHEIIVNKLKLTNIPVISEEGEQHSYEVRKNFKSLWMIDPLDGTKEFLNRNGEFTVNIALIENQKPIIGVIFAPITKDLYFSSKEIGSFKINVKGKLQETTELIAQAHKLPIGRHNNIFTVVASRSHRSSETDEFIKNIEEECKNISLISKGSSLKLCMVAEGIADCYPRFAPTMEWDTAAGSAICMNAGINVIDIKTKTHLKYNKESLYNNWFIVGNQYDNKFIKQWD